LKEKLFFVFENRVW